MSRSGSRPASRSGGVLPLLLALGLFAAPALQAQPLESWREGPARQKILAFVADVTTPGGSHYVTPTERIAVIDDDGTLWPEKPRPQGLFVLPRLLETATANPGWQTRMPFRAALELRGKYLMEASEQAVFALVAEAHAGRTQDDFRNDVRAFVASARHPRFAQPLTRLGYAPMRELIEFLRSNGFRVFVVSAGSVELTRLFVEDMFGIPGDDVFGSGVVTTPRDENGQLVMRRLSTVHVVNDGVTKAQTIDQRIGRWPLVAIGNIGSGGDVDMLRYSQGDGGSGRQSLQLLIRHDDYEREYIYDEKDGASLAAANAGGWTIVSMRYDWRRLFGFESGAVE